MEAPQFREVIGENGGGVTYDCGCTCQPTASASEGGPGFEHCCCGKVHFVGTGAAAALDVYLAERAAKRRREPTYSRGATTVPLASGPVEVAWAFPQQ